MYSKTMIENVRTPIMMSVLENRRKNLVRSETSCDHDRRIIGAGSRPIKPKTRAYRPEAPMVPFRYPRLDHLPSVMESRDQPATMAAVRVGMTRERTPDFLHER